MWIQMLVLGDVTENYKLTIWRSKCEVVKVFKAVFTRWKFARVSQVPGMWAQTFRARKIMDITTPIKIKPDETRDLHETSARAAPGLDTREPTRIV
jgi:hypothetical protein